MKRECLFKNYFREFTVYFLCIIVTFVSFLAVSPNVSAQGTFPAGPAEMPPYDSAWGRTFDPISYDDYVMDYLDSVRSVYYLPSMNYQYSVMDYYEDQISLQGLISDPARSMSEYTYFHMSGASIENMYKYNLYTNPALTALPARSRNMLFEFWKNTSGQTSNPGSITGIPTTTVWSPAGGSSSGSGRKPKPPGGVWLPYTPSNIVWGYGATPGIWSPQGSTLMSGMSGMGF